MNASYEIQFGHLQRPTHCNTTWDWAKYEVRMRCLWVLCILYLTRSVIHEVEFGLYQGNSIASSTIC